MWILLTALVLTPLAGADTLEEDPRVASALRIIEVWVEAQLAYEAIPGISMGVVHDQDLIWSKGFGYANPDKELDATPSTIYSICSISKLFTSVAVMQLRDQGKLSLDEPIKTYLSWFKIGDKYPEAPEVDLRGILTHSAGLPREAGFPYWTGPEYPFPERDSMIEVLPSQEELYPADTYYQYSNLGLTLAGEVVAAVSGRPYSDYIQENILTPLEMRDTSTEIPNPLRGEKLAIGFSRRLRDGSRKEIPPYQVRGIAPAAGFASTVEDLARFASWQFRLLENGGNEVLAVNTLKEMQRVHWLDVDWETTRGIGFSVSRYEDTTIVGHGGSCPGYRTQLALSPKDKVAIIFMTNGQGTSTGTYTRSAFDIVAPAIAEAVESPGEGKKADPALEKYVGRYDRPLGGETHVVIQDGELATLSVPTSNPADALSKLKHMEGDTFRRVRDDGELGEAIRFELDADGKVTKMWRNNNYSVRVY
jgi:CubicO group peptidase (beta-lactamase class C family)